MIEKFIKFREKTAKLAVAVLLLLGLGACTSTQRAPTRYHENKKDEHVTNFINIVKENRVNDLADIVVYPLRRENPLPDVKNKEEFVARYDELFDEFLKDEIINSNVENDWVEVGWRGINGGNVWLDLDGTLRAINYSSPAEQARREELIKKDIENLPPSLKNFEKPEIVLKTKENLIRIDYMGNYKYRYAIWPIRARPLQEPDLIIENGELIFDGSGGNRYYEFKDGKYTYTIYVNVIGDGTRPAMEFVIYREDEEFEYFPAEEIK